MQHFYWIFVNNFLTTCRDDGSIPLNSRICAEFVADTISDEHKHLIAAAPQLVAIVEFLQQHLNEGAQQVSFHALATDDDKTTLGNLIGEAMRKVNGGI